MSWMSAFTVRRAAGACAALGVALTLNGCGSGMPDFAAISEAASQPGDQITVGDPPVRLAVRDEGQGPPVVLIHGLGTNSYTWHRIVPALAKTNRVIAIDLKGFGASEKPLDGPYTVRAQADLVRDVIARKGLRNVTLVGHSYGGGVSLMLTLDEMRAGKKRISRLVLLNSIAYPQDTPLFFSLIQLPVIGDLSVSVIPPEVQIEQALRLAYEEEGAVTDAAIARYSAPLHSAGGKHAVIQTVRNIMPEDVETLARQYPSLTIPTLVVWCEKDRVVPLELGKRLAQNMPRARLWVLRGCGHAPQEEKPAETLEIIQGHAQGKYDLHLSDRNR